MISNFAKLLSILFMVWAVIQMTSKPQRLEDLYFELDSKMNSLQAPDQKEFTQILELCAKIERADTSGGVGPALVRLFRDYPSLFTASILEVSTSDALLILDRIQYEIREQRGGNG